ncbi:unnamed protein product [Cyclocybe aegerita]|uniref:Uncharacterized protein n=1 Tax=Cyclocybe aegerita TaxID=1973307 RepID=A0A8S0WB20_CYCAE|nr:unnamed protein product [Cyclocybe aegerita]
MDIDFCLTCNRKTDDSLYCSPECAGPSQIPPPRVYSDDDDDELSDSTDDDVILHEVEEISSGLRWTGNDNAGIQAWAAEIPFGAPAGGCSSPIDDAYSISSMSSTNYRPPQLLKSPRRVVPPTLCMTTPRPEPPPPSTPMLTPRRQSSLVSVLRNSHETNRTSLISAPTDSSLATPASSHPVPVPIISQRKPSTIGEMYSQVRSWVSPSPVVVIPQPRQPHLPLPRVDSTTNFAFLGDHAAVCWSTIVVDPKQRPQQHTTSTQRQSRGRGRLAPELPPHDEHPSFRTRGRKASRAAA